MGRPENFSIDCHVDFLNCWDFRWNWKSQQLRISRSIVMSISSTVGISDGTGRVRVCEWLQYSRRCTTQPVRLLGECGNERVVFRDDTRESRSLAMI